MNKNTIIIDKNQQKNSIKLGRFLQIILKGCIKGYCCAE
jgi:hypothetical protein